MKAKFHLDSKIFGHFGPARVIKGCAARPAIHYCFSQNCGCSSVVEHLLAKEDVASSSLVTRSSLHLKRNVMRRRSPIMYLWQKAAQPHWLKAREEILQARFSGALSIISRPERKRVQIEIACASRSESQRVIQEFGGCAKRLGRDWLKRFSREEKPKPLRIGRRLVIAPSPSKREAGSFPYSLIVPARAAFGTGEHATTAMSLRLLEEVTRRSKPQFVVDLGTGSGILALAASCFGAKRVVAVDIDPIAVATAQANARLNKIENVDFQLGDVRRWNSAGRIDIATANLFSELLIQILPKLKRSSCLILSGVLRTQEKELVRALRRHKINLVEVRRRGKWIAVLAKTI
jgi:ribosomal protein L11 methyltransferase